MAASSALYSILVDVELQKKSVEKQLKEIAKDPNTKIKIGVDDKSKKQIDETDKSVKKLNESMEGLGLTYQQLQLIASQSIQTFKMFAEQVFELDSAITELKKVSDLSGRSLDKYVSKLSDMGREVARTGKPNRSEPVCCDGKAA